MTEKFHKNNDEILSPCISKKLKELLGEKYDYAVAVIIYTEAKSLEFNYSGMAELRDAFHHVKKAIFAKNDTEALEEIINASDHIRRAATESMQDYIESRFVNFIRRKSLPSLYWSKNNKDKLNDLENQLKEYIYQGRMAKPSKEWEQSIAYFKKAEEILDQLDKEIPSINEKKIKLKIFVYFLIGILSGYFLSSINL